MTLYAYIYCVDIAPPHRAAIKFVSLAMCVVYFSFRQFIFLFLSIRFSSVLCVPGVLLPRTP